MHSIDVDGEPVGVRDQQELAATFLLLFGNDHCERIENKQWDGKHAEEQWVLTGSLTGRAKIIWDCVKQDGWSSARFRETLEQFKRRKPYGDTWSPGDFFECSPEPDLHDREWGLAQIHAMSQARRDPKRELEIYEVAGQQAWRYKSTTPLSFKKLFPR